MASARSDRPDFVKSDPKDPSGSSASGAAEPLTAPATERLFSGKRIIDVHTHVSFEGHDVHKTVQNMDRLGIDVAWLLSWECPPDEYPPWDHRVLSPHKLGIPFEDIVHSVEMYPRRFVAGWAVDPRRPQAKDRLRAAVEMYNVRVYGELKLRLMYDNIDLIEMYNLCGELGLPVLFHLEIELPDPTGRLRVDLKAQERGYWWGGRIDSVERALERCPQTTFIGHASGFWREISGDSERVAEMYPAGPVEPGGKLRGLLDRYPNLYCDISANSGLNALRRDPDHARDFLNTYQDRVLFGRDDFGDALLRFLKTLALADSVLDKILSGNALKLISLDF